MEIEGDNGQEERERWRGKSEALERLHYKAKRLKGETEVRRREDGACGRHFLERGKSACASEGAREREREIAREKRACAREGQREREGEREENREEGEDEKDTHLSALIHSKSIR